MELEAVKARVTALFKEICKIPRPSRKEERIADFVCAFAKDHGCDTYRDGANNVFVKVKATEGYEDVPPILLQGHLDMVCEKNADSAHDFFRDGITYTEKDGFLIAEETTLGADNGVAVALMLFVIEGGVPAHGEIECLFTAGEEIGLLGAKAFDYSRIRARRMINLDSETENEITVGCAGGVRSDIFFAPRYTETAGTVLCLTVGGLAGGHSGADIDKGRANAVSLLSSLLSSLYTATGLSLISLEGGDKDNAIPREAVAIIAAEDEAEVVRAVTEFSASVRESLIEEDQGFFLTAERVCDAPSQMMDALSTRTILAFLATVKCGVMAMSRRLPSLVEYSKNLAAVHTGDRGVAVTVSSRSAMERLLDESMREIDILASLCYAMTYHSARYPGWAYAGKSAMKDKYAEVLSRLYGKEVKTTVIHAGLECGIIKGALPEMDAISVGPNMHGIHAVGESLDLDSFGRFAYAIATLLGEK